MILARIISIFTNPVFVLITLTYLLVYKETNSAIQAWNWTFYTLIYIFLFCSFVLYGVRKRIFSDIDVSNRKQRPLVYFVGALFSILYIISLYFLKGPSILTITTFGIVLGVIVAALINIKIKASIHAASFSAFIIILAMIYGKYFLLLLFLILLVGWARVKIKRHTLKEVIVGAMLGILTTLAMYVIELRMFINKL